MTIQSLAPGPRVTTSHHTVEERRSALLRTQEEAVTGTHVAAFLVRARPMWAKVGYSVLATAIAGSLTALMAPELERVAFVLLWPAVLFSALIGNMGTAALSSVMSVLIVDYFVLETGGPAIGQRDLMPIALFLLASLAMSSIANALRVARQRSTAATHELHQLAVELDEQATDLEQQLEESQSLQEELEQTSVELAERTGDAERAGAFSRGILASITDPLVVNDADWRVVFINEEAERTFRRGDRRSLIGARLWDVNPDLLGTAHEEHMRRAAEEGRPVTYEAFNPAAGTWSVTSCYPLSDGGLVMQWKDVTARRRAEESARYLARASEVLGASLDH